MFHPHYSTIFVTIWRSVFVSQQCIHTDRTSGMSYILCAGTGIHYSGITQNVSYSNSCRNRIYCIPSPQCAWNVSNELCWRKLSVGWWWEQSLEPLWRNLSWCLQESSWHHGSGSSSFSAPASCSIVRTQLQLFPCAKRTHKLRWDAWPAANLKGIFRVIQWER